MNGVTRALRRLTIALSILAFAALSFGGTVRLATLAPKDSSFDKSLKRMGQAWREATGGEDRLLVYASGQQGSEGAMIKKMEINRLHAALVSGVGLADIDRSIAVLQQVPLLYRDYDELEHVMEKMQGVFEERIQAKGFVVLGWLDTGWVRIFSKNKLLTPDDMRESKLFTWSGDAPQTAMLKKMGFRPVPIDSTEINSSMSTGLIDTVPMPPFFALASQIYNPAPYMLDFNYAPMVGAIIVNKRTWDKYSPEVQLKIKSAAEEAAAEMRESGRAESDESIRVMRDEWSLKVSELTPETRAEWQAISKEAYVHIRDNTVPADIWDQVVSILDEYRAGTGE